MPLTPEQTTAVEAFTEALAGADAKELAEALKPHPVYQAIFGAGHSTATKDSKAKLKEKDDELTTVRAELEEAKEESTRLAATNPDHAAEKTRLEQALAAAKTAAEETKKTAAEDVRKVRRDVELAKVEAALAARENDLEWVKFVTVPQNSERIRVEDDGSVTYFDADGVTPLTAGFDGFVEQLHASIDPKHQRSGVAAGSGARGSEARNGQSGRIKALEEAARAPFVRSAPSDSPAAKARADRYGAQNPN